MTSESQPSNDNLDGAAPRPEFVSLRKWLRGGKKVPAAVAAAIGVDVCDALTDWYRSAKSHGAISNASVAIRPDQSAVLLPPNQVRPLAVFLAPELSLPAAKPDVVSDIYALGCLLYRIYRGRHLVHAEPHDPVAAEVRVTAWPDDDDISVEELVRRHREEFPLDLHLACQTNTADHGNSDLRARGKDAKSDSLLRIIASAV
ncbi:MAG: hypothetical protein AAFP69_06635, partial [Planctomycetota bacterium]